MPPDLSNVEVGGLAVLGTLGSVCAVLLRSTKHNLDSLAQMREEANAVINELRDENRDNDETISKLQALCADYRYHIGALKAGRRQLKLEIQRLERLASERPTLAAQPIPNPINEKKEGN